MLDDGESQAGAAGLFGMAFVHPVEPLEDPLLLILGNADTGVCDNDLFALQGRAHPDADRTAPAVVLDGVFTDVVDHLIQDLAHAVADYIFSGNLHVDGPFLRLGRQTADDPPGQIIEIHVFFFHLNLAFVQLGQFDDILYQGDQTAGFIIDTLCKAFHIFWSYQAVLHDLRVSGYGGQRRLQLMGYVGGKLFAHVCDSVFLFVLFIDSLQQWC